MEVELHRLFEKFCLEKSGSGTHAMRYFLNSVREILFKPDFLSSGVLNISTRWGKKCVFFLQDFFKGTF